MVRKLLALLLALNLAACNTGGGGTVAQPQPSQGPSPGQFTVYGGDTHVNSDGSFQFGTGGLGAGYIYTTPQGPIAGKTITLTYTVSGPGTVVPAPASGTGQAEVRLFIWRRGDDMQCTSTTEWFRWWSASGVGPLTVGTHTITAVISEDTVNRWTDCYGHADPNQFSGTTANVLGVGFTFGAEFFGHGVYSTGQNWFTVNSFTIQ